MYFHSVVKARSCAKHAVTGKGLDLSSVVRLPLFPRFCLISRRHVSPRRRHMFFFEPAQLRKGDPPPSADSPVSYIQCSHTQSQLQLPLIDRGFTSTLLPSEKASVYEVYKVMASIRPNSLLTSLSPFCVLAIITLHVNSKP